MPNKWINILHSQTPKKWLEKAIDFQEILLIDHAHCEKKAATTAISLIHRYPDKNLAKKLSPLAREELLHFEQVLRVIQREGYKYRNIRPGAYAKTLYEASSNQEPQRLKETLINVTHGNESLEELA